MILNETSSVMDMKVESFIPAGNGETYYVSPNGNDSNPGTQAQPWKTVGYATSSASVVGAGDTILVQPGTYTEQINLEKSGNAQDGHIVLKAEGDVTILDPTPTVGEFQDAPVKSRGQGYWVIDGFQIKNTSWAGISLQDANNMVVQNNHTFETGASGIIVLPDTFFGGGEAEVTSSNIKVLNNTIERANNRWVGRGDSRGTQEALSIWGVDGFEVAGNFVNGGTREGIDIKTGSRNGTVHNNTVTGVASISGTPGGYNGGPAIYIEGNRSNTFNVDVYNNVVYGNTADGIIVADEETAPEEGDVRDVRIFNNVVYDNGIQGTNGGVGIGVTSNVSDIEVFNNTVVGNVQSLVVDRSDFNGGYDPTNIVVRNNIFANDTYIGGFIDDVDNLTLDNNIFANSFGQPYVKGAGSTNLTETNNVQVASAGFVDPATNNYRLLPDSVAVNAGSGAIPSDVTIDQDGNPRRAGEAIDLGAFEFTTVTPTPTPNPVPTPDSGPRPNPEPSPNPTPTPTPEPSPVPGEGNEEDGSDSSLPSLDLTTSRQANAIQVTQTGTSGDDNLTGSADNDSLDGLDGSDTLFARAGDDNLEGQEGDDLLFSSAGNDFLNGGLGSDILYTGQGNDAAFGGEDNDSIWGDRGADSISGGDGNDLLFGNVDADLVLGDGGDDTIFGGFDNDSLAGEQGMIGSMGMLVMTILKGARS
ncbi:MAG: hypothetical protein HC835_15665 [Oscillatoriales cyanobacterium RM2_1_1]|nr:hypothetical protein [Oscillatoriales cyanobacterium RM2_1_1]